MDRDSAEQVEGVLEIQVKKRIDIGGRRSVWKLWTYASAGSLEWNGHSAWNSDFWIGGKVTPMSYMLSLHLHRDDR